MAHTHTESGKEEECERRGESRKGGIVHPPPTHKSSSSSTHTHRVKRVLKERKRGREGGREGGRAAALEEEGVRNRGEGGREVKDKETHHESISFI